MTNLSMGRQAGKNRITSLACEGGRVRGKQLSECRVLNKKSGGLKAHVRRGRQKSVLILERGTQPGDLSWGNYEIIVA